MPTAAAIGGAGILGAGAQIWGAQTAANAQQANAQAAIAAQEQMFGQAQQSLNPFIQAGQSVLPTIQNLLTPGANMNQTLSQLPGFQFANTYGLMGLSNQATSRGLSGNALTAGAQYSSGLAQQNYSNYLQQLMGLSGQGQQAASSLAGGAITTGQGIGSNITGIGNAQAAAANATGNAVASGANSIGNLATLNALTGGKLFNTSNITNMFSGTGT